MFGQLLDGNGTLSDTLCVDSFLHVNVVLQLMCLIGEGFDLSSDEVCGAVVQNRSKGDKIAIWTGDSTRSDDILHIG